MDEIDERTLDQKLPYLQSQLTAKHMIAYLQSARLFTKAELDEIVSQKDNNSQVGVMVRCLKQAGDTAFESFLRVLQNDDVKRGFVAKDLREERERQRKIPQEWPQLQPQQNPQAMLEDALKATQRLVDIAHKAETRFEKLEKKHEALLKQMENYCHRVEKDKGAYEKQLESKREEIKRLKEELAALKKTKTRAKGFQGKIKALEDNLAKAEKDKKQMAEEIRRGKELEKTMKTMEKQIRDLEIKDKKSEEKFRYLAAEFEKAKKQRDQALGTRNLLSGLSPVERVEALYTRGGASATPRDTGRTEEHC